MLTETKLQKKIVFLLFPLSALKKKKKTVGAAQSLEFFFLPPTFVEQKVLISNYTVEQV